MIKDSIQYRVFILTKIMSQNTNIIFSGRTNVPVCQNILRYMVRGCIQNSKTILF